MQDETVKIRITQSSFGVEEGQEYYATVEENGFSACVQGEELFIPDGEAELVEG